MCVYTELVDMVVKQNTMLSHHGVYMLTPHAFDKDIVVVKDMRSTEPPYRMHPRDAVNLLMTHDRFL